MVAERVFPGRRGVFLVIGMIDGDGGIDIEMQPAVAVGGRPHSPGTLSRMCPRRPDPGQPTRIDAFIDTSPQCGRRGNLPEGVLAVTPQLTHTVNAVRAVSHRSGQIGEHLPRRICPRPPIRSANTAVTCDDSPVSSATSRKRPSPACDTTPQPSADTFSRETPALPFT